MHPFFTLRDQLPALVFDPDAKSKTPDLPLLQQYLNFYHLKFLPEICSNHQIGTLHIDPYQIVVQYWLPAKPCLGTVWFLHGYYDHVGLFSDLIKFLLTHGFAVAAYDQPGHGLSSGEQASITDFSEYTNVFTCCLNAGKSMPHPWFFAGQSTGCAVLLHSLLIEKINAPFQQIILLAPLIKPAKWKTGRWIYRLVAPFKKEISRRVSENSHNKEFVEFVHHLDPLQSRFLKTAWVGAMKRWLECFPTLETSSTPINVIQGNKDETVDWQYNIAQIKCKFSRASVHIIPGAGHHLSNERSDLQQQVFSQLLRFLLASP